MEIAAQECTIPTVYSMHAAKCAKVETVTFTLGEMHCCHLVYGNLVVETDRCAIGANLQRIWLSGTINTSEAERPQSALTSISA